MAKNGQNRTKWPQKDVSDIKNFYFLHHTSLKSSLKYGPNRFLVKNEPKKLTPLLGQRMAKIGQNGPKKVLMISKTSVFYITLAQNLTKSMAPIIFLQKNQPKEFDPTLQAQKWPKSAKIGQNGLQMVLVISKTSVFCITLAPNLA
jgi:hypothetical protein